MNESKKQRFERIAEPRVNAVLDKLRLLGQCSNRNNYEFDKKQISQMFSTIETELKRIKVLYQKPNGKEDPFSF